MRAKQIKRTKNKVRFSITQDDEHIGEMMIDKHRTGWLWFWTYWDPRTKTEKNGEGASVSFGDAVRALKKGVNAGWDADPDILAEFDPKFAKRKPTKAKKCPTCGR